MDYSPEVSHDYSQKNKVEKTSTTNSTSRISGTNEELDFNTTSNFSYDKAGSGGLLGPVFGFTKKVYVYTPNSRRVKIKYWDRDWIFFQSKGAEVRFQKKKRILWTTVWQKSYPTKVALGFNHITYEAKTYNTFDWEAFNKTSGKGIDVNGLTYIYRNRIYNSNGLEKPSLSNGLTFPIKSLLNADDFPIQIYYMWNKKRKSINVNITEEVSSLINKTINTQTKGAINKLKSKGVTENTPVKFFDFSQNSMSYSLANINNTQKDNAITKYLDFGVLVSIKLKGDNFSNFNISSKPLNLVEIKSFDMYGAALYNGVWYGKRIIGYNK